MRQDVPSPPPAQPPDDGMLVSYLDGELDPASQARVEAALSDAAVAARLATLAAGGIPADAFASLLDAAPTARLNAMLDALPGLDAKPAAGPAAGPAAASMGSTSPAASRPGPEGSAPPMAHKGGAARPPGLAPPVRAATAPPDAARAGWTRRGAIAASLALLAAGALSDRLASRIGWPGGGGEAGEAEGVEEAPDHWRASVAQYLALYTPDTLADVPDDAAVRIRQLGRVGGRLGLALTPSRVAVADATLKSARLLSYDDEPLGQITYLDATGPMALCAMRVAGPAMPVRTERRLGMNVAYWSDGTHALMLIGHRSSEAMQDAARVLSASLAQA